MLELHKVNPPTSANAKLSMRANKDRVIRLFRVYPIQTARLWDLNVDDEEVALHSGEAFSRNPTLWPTAVVLAFLRFISHGWS